MTEKIYPIRIVKHKTSDLLMAILPDVPGFILHAYSLDEMEEKLPRELKLFMEATNRPIEAVEVIRDEAPAGFWPPAFAAKALLDERMAA